jgi:multiple sugar transport system substrate-binding protein
VYGTNEPNNWLYMLPLVRSTGTGFFNKDATRFTLADKPASDAVQAIADLSLVDHVAPSPALMTSFPDAPTMVATGRMAMAISGTWDLNTFGSVKFPEGIAAIPMFKTPQNIAWTAGYAISKNAKNAAAAWSVLHSMLTYPVVYQLGQQMPPFKSWFTDPTKYKLWAANPVYHPAGFQQFASGTVLNPAIGVQGENVYVKNFGKMMDNFVTPGMDPIFAGKKTAAQVLPGIAAQVKSLVSGRW